MSGQSDEKDALVHWVGEGPTSLHGNGAASFARGSGDEDEVTCSLCQTLLARGEHLPEYDRHDHPSDCGGDCG